MSNKASTFISLAALIVAGCGQSADENATKSVPVKVFVVKAESISDYIRATGPVMADQDVVVYSKVSERIEKINVRPGQAVAADQVLVEQRNELLKQGLDVAQAGLQTAEAHARLAAADHERMNNLYAEKAISPQQYDQSRTAKETAELGREQARSLYEQAREQLDNSLIRAPFSGVVAAVYVERDQMVAMWQPVVQIVSPARMKAKVNLGGADLRNVRAGQRVTVKFPAIPGAEFTGRVDQINTSIDRMTRALEVEIGILSNDKRIASGMFGEFFIETRTSADRPVIPETALLPQTEIRINKETGLQNTFKRFFLFLVRDNTARMKEVKTGIANDGQTEITEGLSLGDSVIVVGQNIVKDGQLVNVTE